MRGFCLNGCAANGFISNYLVSCASRFQHVFTVRIHFPVQRNADALLLTQAAQTNWVSSTWNSVKCLNEALRENNVDWHTDVLIIIILTFLIVKINRVYHPHLCDSMNEVSRMLFHPTASLLQYLIGNTSLLLA